MNVTDFISLQPPPSESGGRLNPRAVAVIRHLLGNGPASRIHIAHDLMSAASMSRLVRILVDEGLVTEGADPSRPPARVGRPAQLLSAVPSARHVIGVTLTANTAHGVVCDLLGSVVNAADARLPTPVDHAVPVDTTIEVVARLVRRLAHELPTLDAVAVSFSGTVSERGAVREGRVVKQLIDNGHLLSHAPVTGGVGPVCELGHRGCVAAYLYRPKAVEPVCDERAHLALADRSSIEDNQWRTEAAQALAHLVATFAGGLQTERVVVAGEEAKHLVTSPVFNQTLNDRLRHGDGLRLELDVSVEPAGFAESARGAAVLGIQYILGAAL